MKRLINSYAHTLSIKVKTVVWLILLLAFHGSTQARIGSGKLPLADERPRLAVTLGHTGRVNAIAISPEGRFALSGGDDAIACLWDIDKGAEIRRLEGHGGGIHYVAFFPDNTHALTGSADNTARVWDLATGKETKRFEAFLQVSHGGVAGCFALSPDGQLLFTVDEKNNGLIHNVNDQSLKRRLEGHTGNLVGASFSPNNEFLATSCSDGTTRLWNVTTAALVWMIKDAGAGASSVAFSKDGQRLLIGSTTIRMRNAMTGALIRSFTGDDLLVLSVAFSPDGHYVLAGSWKEAARLWDVNASAPIQVIPHKQSVAAVAFSKTGEYFLTGSWDGRIRLWQTGTARLIRNFVGEINNVLSIGFSPQGPHVVSASGNNIANVWDSTSTTTLKSFAGHAKSLTSAAMSYDGKLLVTGSGDGTASLWDVDTGKELQRFENHSQYVMDPTFSLDNNFVLTTGGFAYFWDVRDGGLKKRMGEQDILKMVFRGKLSRDGRFALTVQLPRFSKSASLWDIAQNKVVRPLEGPAATGEFSADGASVATAGLDSVARVFKISDSSEPKQLKGHTGSINAVIFSADGATLLTGGDDATARLWDIASSKQLAQFNHLSAVERVAPSADGKFLLTQTRNDNIVHLWNTQEKEELCRIVAFTDGAWAVVDMDGRFDTNNLERIPGLSWILPKSPMQVLPLEIFMRNYYEPRLLNRLMEMGKNSLPVTPSLAQLNVNQAKVEIADVKLSKDAPGKATVLVKVLHSEDQLQPTYQGARGRERVYDLRLFRDGQLVSYAPKAGGEIALDNSGTALVQFPVSLPRDTATKEVEFTAYAFNSDRVKSGTARKTIQVQNETGVVKGRTYLITIGVNAYENEKWDLSFAANDAITAEAALKAALSRRGEDPITIQLISDYERNQAGKTQPRAMIKKTATKTNFRAVIDLLAGRPVDAAVINSIQNANLVKKAEAEDRVIIFFSSHGYVNSSGVFFLLPYDTGLNASKDVDEARCISSDELAEWLRDVDAGEMVMVVDACHSAGAIKNNDFKPGPMGSRGLGQLAYDKGMRILAATQVEGVALELESLKQGVLTYALVRDGLESGQADYKPKDESLTLQEWLNYGADRVPGLYEDIRAGRLKALGGATSRDPIISIANDANASFLKTRSLLQQPLLFDFSKKQNPTLLVGNDPYIPIRPDFDRLQLESDPARERRDLAAAADLPDAAAAADALKRFIASHYDRPSGVFARILLIGALLEAKASSGELAGACRDANAFVRDTSPDGRMYRVKVYKVVAEELAKRGQLISEATEFVEKALSILPKDETYRSERLDLQKLLSTLKPKVFRR